MQFNYGGTIENFGNKVIIKNCKTKNYFIREVDRIFLGNRQFITSKNLYI